MHILEVPKYPRKLLIDLADCGICVLMKNDALEIDQHV